ncbi:MAG: hypothetical protein DRH89_02885 [Candidatus Cloacimonadota bacterium]|nr:MAG: hypothetical protein DRH89_02885 [Candidatus Cloacimonadota bacterium]
MPFLTVGTATYNFKDFIIRSYESLRLQTYRDFEWIIVDDGSDDNTDALVASWIKQNSIKIRYYKFSENKGKMAAMNFAIREAEGIFFVPLDADDTLKDYALDHIVKKWYSINHNLQEQIAALVFNCEDQHGNKVGTLFPSDPLICDYFDLKFKYKVRGDKIQIYKTKVLLEFPYYDHVDKHVIHSATYFDIAYHYKLYCSNEFLFIYYQNETGKIRLSQKLNNLRFIKGRQFYAEKRINKYFNRIKSIKFRMETFISYYRYSHHSGIKLNEMFKRINLKRFKIFFIFIIPFGFIIVIMDKLRKRI